MLAKTQTAGLWGIQAQTIIVETDLQQGLPALHVVGLADLTIREARERIRAAIINSGYAFPNKRITINLSPAGTPKEGSHFDLPIAVGILLLDQWRKKKKTAEPQQEENLPALIGELSLDGRVHPVRGVLPMVLGLREQGVRRIILPEKNMGEVSSVGDVEFYPVSALSQVMDYLETGSGISIYKRKKPVPEAEAKWEDDFCQVQGQQYVKRALTVAAAGQHGVLMMGSPGSGKSMMARRMPSIMPEMTYEEQMEITKIHSICGLLTENAPAVRQRPFRAPHHTISDIALVGGGKRPAPGEISLAHNGILFLDELGEFPNRSLNLLRQPMEDGFITINRASGSLKFPSRFMLVAASNPCKCGYFGDDTHQCTCTERQLQSYMTKFSGPLIDRIDLHIRISSPEYKTGEKEKQPLSSAEMRENVVRAGKFQQRRYKGTGITANSRLNSAQIKEYCALGDREQKMMETAYSAYRLNMRSCHKILKTARTIADLAESELIEEEHLAEAMQYRSLEYLYRRG